MKEYGLKTRILSAVLCALMVGTALPVQALASGTTIIAETETADTTVDGVFSTVLPVEEDTTDNTAVDGVFSTVMEIEGESESEQGQVRNLNVNEGIATQATSTINYTAKILGNDLTYDLNGSTDSPLMGVIFYNDITNNTFQIYSNGTAVNNVETFSKDADNKLYFKFTTDGTKGTGWSGIAGSKEGMYRHFELKATDSSVNTTFPDDEDVIYSLRYETDAEIYKSGSYVLDLKDGEGWENLIPSGKYRWYLSVYTIGSQETHYSMKYGNPIGIYSTLKITEPSGIAKKKIVTAEVDEQGSQGFNAYWWSGDANKKPTAGPEENVLNIATWEAWTTQPSITVSYPGIYYCWAGIKGKKGIVAYTQMKTTGVDNVRPTVDVSYSTTDWTRGNVTITANASDSNGIGGYYWTTGTETPTDSSTWVSDNTKTVSANCLWYVWAKDAAGNISASGAKAEVSNIDRTAPTVDNISYSTSSGGANGSADIIATASDTGGSGIAGYYWSTGSTAPSANDSGWVSSTSTTNTKTVTANGTWYVWVKDLAGNISSGKSVTVTNVVDVTVPINPTITLQPGVSGEAQTGALTITNNSTSAGVKVALGSIVAMDGQGAKLSLVKGDTTFAEGDDLLSAGAALGVKVSGGSTVWYDPTSATQTVFATISAGGSVNFQYVMKHSPYYSGVATTFGYKISYNFETAS